MEDRKQTAEIKATPDEIQEARNLLESCERAHIQDRRQKQDFSNQIKNATPAVISQILVDKDKRGRIGIVRMANMLDANSFQKLIEKASAESINEALILQDDASIHYHSIGGSLFSTEGTEKFSIFNGILANQRTNNEGIKTLINKASPEVISQILNMNNDFPYRTSFQRTVDYCDTENFSLLVDKASIESISQALVLKNYFEETGLQYMLKVTRTKLINQENFKNVIDKASVYTLCTALLVGANDQTGRAELREVLLKKVPFLTMMLTATPSQQSDFEALYNAIFLNDTLNSKQMSLADCKLWLSFLNRVSQSVKDEKIKNLVEASLMRLSLFLSLKEKDRVKKQNYKEKAMEHAMQITSPAGLSIDDNYLIFDFYKMKSQEFNGLQFLKQAAIDCELNNKKYHNAYIEFMAKVSKDDDNLFKLLDDKNTNDSKPEEETKNAEVEKEAQYKEYLIKQYLGEIATSLNKLRLASRNENQQTKHTVDALTTKIGNALLQARLSLDAMQNEQLEKKEEIMGAVLKNLKTCFDQENATIQKLETNKSIRPFLKNLAVCIATMPFFGAGFFYAGAWAIHYAKHKEHLRFNLSATTKEAKTLHRLDQKFKSLLHKK